LYLHVHKVLEHSLGRALARSGLNPSTWLGLLMIYSDPERAVHPSQISALSVSSRTNATRVAEELVQRGWITRVPSAADRRRVELRLTPVGEEAVERLLPVQRGRLVDLWAGLSSGEQHTLERLLRKLLRSLPADDPAGDGDARWPPPSA